MLIVWFPSGIVEKRHVGGATCKFLQWSESWGVGFEVWWSFGHQVFASFGILTHLDPFLNSRGWFKEQDDPGKRCSHGGIRLERQEIYGVSVPETGAFSEELLLGRLGSWSVLWDGERKSMEKPKRLTGFYGEKLRPLCNSGADGICNDAEICRLLAKGLESEIFPFPNIILCWNYT